MLDFFRPGLRATPSRRHTPAWPTWTGTLLRGSLLALACTLSACGGGKGGDSTVDADPQRSNNMLSSAALKPVTDAEAYRFLTQATFGPTPDEAARLKRIGYEQWIDEQFDMHLQSTHLQMVNAQVTALNQSGSGAPHVINSWWTHAVRDPAQLRQRIAFALSEIFVVSISTIENGRRVASYLDMLTDHADANFRDLLETVALHPAMGQYLSHLGNFKEDPTTGRVPDENFAREIMQLFSIGLYELDDSANPRLISGNPVETYSSDDIKGLARVFTGFSWYRPTSKVSANEGQCYWRLPECWDDSQDTTSMAGYSSAHSTSVKQFLGVTVAAQTEAAPAVSLRAALDRLASHNNTAPFISKQLIQRLVTSNPSNDYVADITRVFRATNGNLRAVVKAILLHREARTLPTAPQQRYTYGKLREPVLKLTHLLRAIPHVSYMFEAQVAKGTKLPFYDAEDSSDVGTSLGQTPMRSPSVFNFFRPGYKPPQTEIAASGMVAPEMQITSETSVMSYANLMSGTILWGWGMYNNEHRTGDIALNVSAWDSVANSPAALMSTMSQRLLGHELSKGILDEAVATIESMPATTTAQRTLRTKAAILMVVVSPDFTVQQ